MPSAKARTLLIASGFGAVVGVAAAAAEALVPGAAVPLEAYASYGLIGAAAAFCARVLLGRWDEGNASARTSALIFTGFASGEILYFVNVRLLAGEHYLSRRSLVADATGLVLPALTAVALFKAPRLRAARRLYERPFAWVSGAVLIGIPIVLFEVGQGTSVAHDADHATGPNLLLIVLDSARRDHLGMYGYGRPTSPALDEIARHSLVYDAGLAAAPWTVPSVSKLMTGSLDGHGAAPSLPEALGRRGYATACFTDNPHMGRDSPLLEGFGVVARSVGSWRHFVRGTVVGGVVERIAPGSDAALVDEAIDFGRHSRQPTLLYVHLMDSHTPYRFAPIVERRHAGRRIEFPMTGMALSANEAEDIVDRYDGGLRSASDQAARLLSAASSWGRPFVAVVTADHGESLGEGGRWFHGGSLAPELLAVPLIVTGAGVTPGRASAAAGHDAVRTTLLSAAGVGGTEFADLRSGTGLGIVDGGLPPRLGYRVLGGFQLVVDYERGTRRLFRLGGDGKDLAASRPELVKILAQGMSTPGRPEAPADEIRERLRAIGYVD